MKSVACCLTIALASSAATTAWGQTPPSCQTLINGIDLSPACLRDLGVYDIQRRIDAIDRQLRALDRQNTLRRDLDDQRFWIDMDARIRQDDIEYNAWFRREFDTPYPGDQHRSRR